jgi:hypothetical protein
VTTFADTIRKHGFRNTGYDLLGFQYDMEAELEDSDLFEWVDVKPTGNDDCMLAARCKLKADVPSRVPRRISVPFGRGAFGIPGLPTIPSRTQDVALFFILLPEHPALASLDGLSVFNSKLGPASEAFHDRSTQTILEVTGSRAQPPSQGRPHRRGSTAHLISCGGGRRPLARRGGKLVSTSRGCIRTGARLEAAGIGGKAHPAGFPQPRLVSVIVRAERILIRRAD